jgi:hypothetical protein
MRSSRQRRTTRDARPSEKLNTTTTINMTDSASCKCRTTMIENSRRIDREREKANKHAGFHAVLTVAAKSTFLRPRIAPLAGPEAELPAAL